LFSDLCRAYKVQPDKRGEAHVPCPHCGAEPPNRFSFGQGGGHCFVCGYSYKLETLAKKLRLDPPAETSPAQTKKRKRKYYAWQDRAGDLADRYALSPGLVAAWQQYKPVSRTAILAHRLGLGVLPSSRCSHERLIVPLVDFAGKVVGFRGRAIDCDCGAWLSPGGNKATLYNWQSLGQYQIVFIVENAIDALLFTERVPGAVAVATLSVSYWQDEWLARLQAAHPLCVVVAYDNHRPGNGKGRAEWLATHSRDILPNGVKLVNRLLEARITARLFDWGSTPIGADVGSVLCSN
jgi:hypothetical protein